MSGTKIELKPKIKYVKGIASSSDCRYNQAEGANNV